MAKQPQLRHPWLVAVWPGMGGVAINGGIYLLAKLDMQPLAEVNAGDLFDASHVEVKGGLIQAERMPRNAFFVWRDPAEKRDLVLFLGEAQPPLGRSAFCRRLVAYAKDLGVERVLTFAAMATDMDPRDPSRVFAAATDKEGLAELERFEPTVLQEGRISGLNGLLLGVAAEAGLRGACLLGEMPHVFHQLPFPKASLAVLEVLKGLAGLEIDLAELAEQARASEQELGAILDRLAEEQGEGVEPDEGESPGPPPGRERRLGDDERRLEQLFEQAATDRSKAFELKQELDRLGLFKEYEDRFLDLFKKRAG